MPVAKAVDKAHRCALMICGRQALGTVPLCFVMWQMRRRAQGDGSSAPPTNGSFQALLIGRRDRIGRVRSAPGGSDANLPEANRQVFRKDLELLHL